MIRSAKTIEKVVMYNELGNEVYRSQSLGQTTQYTIAGTFSAGLYVVKVSYTDGSQEMKNIVKLD